MEIDELKNKCLSCNPLSENEWLKVLRTDGSLLEHAPFQTIKMCQAAVNQTMHAIEHVNAEWSSLKCAFARNSVELDPFKIVSTTDYFNGEELTTILMCAVKKDPAEVLSAAWDFSLTLPPSVYEHALQVDGQLIGFIDEPREQYIDIALKNTPTIFFDCLTPNEQTDSRGMSVVQRDGMLLEHFQNQTYEICKQALAQNPMAIIHLHPQWQTMEFFSFALSSSVYQGRAHKFIHGFSASAPWPAVQKAQIMTFINLITTLDQVDFSDEILNVIINAVR